MKWLKVVCAELYGVFVDDARFAGAILTWLAACWLGVGRLGLPREVAPLLLTGGLVAILMQGAAHRARRLR